MEKLTMVQWPDIKHVLAANPNLIPALTWFDTGSYYHITLPFAGNSLKTIVKKGVIDAVDFETNFLPYIIPCVDRTGKYYHRQFSGDQGSDTYCHTANADDTSPGNGSAIEWDASLTPGLGGLAFDDSTSKVISLTFLEAVRIFSATLQWTDGDWGCRGDFWIVVPAGVPIDTDGDGVDETYPFDIPVAHYAINKAFPGNCTGGWNLPVESATEPLRAGWELRIVLTKPSANVLWHGNIELTLYRQTTV